ncbi:hypothetical protein [Micromonospora auratinigra]|uniref:EcsC protein family protein n=1 Tax=Micromonospora auratinigra TaxID=261654 RepID=A0A1A8ZZP7_9ACTN|nr:hypothetical protein [Micromonospora auratinigra]SBT49365.1 hypothetical protein GA0070611_4389 [Micromonospora auratinigra]
MQEQPPSDPPRREPAPGARRSRSTEPTFTPPPSPPAPADPQPSEPVSRERRTRKAAPTVLFRPPDPAGAAPTTPAGATPTTPAATGTPDRAQTAPAPRPRPAAEPTDTTPRTDAGLSTDAPAATDAPPGADVGTARPTKRATARKTSSATKGEVPPAGATTQAAKAGTRRAAKAAPAAKSARPTAAKAAPAPAGTDEQPAGVTRSTLPPAGPTAPAVETAPDTAGEQPAQVAESAEQPTRAAKATARRAAPVAKKATPVTRKRAGRAEVGTSGAPVTDPSPVPALGEAPEPGGPPGPVETVTADAEPTERPEQGRPTDQGWREVAARVLDHPGFAPELLAGAAVAALGPRAGDWAERTRAAYPDADADGLARLATRRFVRLAGTGGALAAGAGLFAPAAELAAVLWTQANLVLHLAAVYGREPGHPDRVPELLVLTQVHPDLATARAALDAVRSAGAPVDGTWPRAAEAAWRLATPLAAQAGGWWALRLASRLLPGAAPLTAATGGTAAAERLAARARALYRPGRVGLTGPGAGGVIAS